MTIKEIKEMNNAQLIEKLLYCAEKETQKTYNDGKRIIKELQNRKIIKVDDIIKPFDE